jgi:glycerophosphoryl diester phosphodiesterase
LKPWLGPKLWGFDLREKWLHPRVLAHRGGGSLAPENTLSALRYAADHDFRGVEVDAMLAADGVPILMHDPIFGRTIKKSGSVASSSSLDLSRLDAGSWYSDHYVGEPVPSLEAAITLCQATSLWMNIEIKPSSEQAARATGRKVGAVAKVLYADMLGSPRAPVLSSFSLEALLGARETAPELARGILVDAIPLDWQQRLELADAGSLHVNVQNLREEQVQQMVEAGIPIMAYTVNSPELARQLFTWGVCAVCTDRLDLIAPNFF